MSVYVPAALRREVRQRAGGRCEYCRILASLDVETFPLDHVRALGHGGPTISENLALACLPCNQWKGPNLGAVDPTTDEPAWLFDPRRDVWEDHFTVVAGRAIGLTPEGRATAALIRMNEPDRVRLRTASFHAANAARP